MHQVREAKQARIDRCVTPAADVKRAKPQGNTAAVMLQPALIPYDCGYQTECSVRCTYVHLCVQVAESTTILVRMAAKDFGHMRLVKHTFVKDAVLIDFCLAGFSRLQCMMADRHALMCTRSRSHRIFGVFKSKWMIRRE